MTTEKMEWMVRGEACDACNSPPVCPYWWGSPVQAQLHGGKDHGEGAFTFNIREGYYGDVDLSWDQDVIPLSDEEVKEELMAGEPRLAYDGTTVRVRCLRDGEEVLVARVLREFFERASAGS